MNRSGSRDGVLARDERDALAVFARPRGSQSGTHDARCAIARWRSGFPLIPGPIPSDSAGIGFGLQMFRYQVERLRLRLRTSRPTPGSVCPQSPAASCRPTADYSLVSPSRATPIPFRCDQPSRGQRPRAKTSRKSSCDPASSTNSQQIAFDVATGLRTTL
jgi:hypothetical protein